MFPDSTLDEKSLLAKVCKDASLVSGMCARGRADYGSDESDFIPWVVKLLRVNRTNNPLSKRFAWLVNGSASDCHHPVRVSPCKLNQKNSLLPTGPALRPGLSAEHSCGHYPSFRFSLRGPESAIC
ncbi:MAG: hypothetical protein CMM57_09305 [Rhodospirillaceae bacterium]|nr:hypothetical protein [Rhodospirillaceae bacterium]